MYCNFRNPFLNFFMIKIYGYIIFLCLIFFSTGCREEIVPPNNDAGNINQPIKISTSNSYTFLINAKQISQEVTETPEIIIAKTKLSITISDYAGGSLRVSLYNKNHKIIYSSIGNANNGYLTYTFDKDFPTTINIKFKNFSGRLKIYLSII